MTVEELLLQDYFDDDISAETTDSQISFTSTTADASISVSLVQNTSQGCGGCVWPASDLLCYHLKANFPKLSSRWILELGSGTGVVGIWLAKLLGKHALSGSILTLTDLDFLVPLMRENVMRNGFSCDTINVVPLAWGQPGLPPNLPAFNDNPPLILISDCVYLESLFDPLLMTLNQLLSACEGAVCWMSYRRRRRADRIFFQRLRKMFQVRTIASDPVYLEFQRNRLFLYEIQCKPRIQ
jgi:protein N-lysine methyltransferase METTL21A